MSGITADDVTDQSENEELLVENEDNQLIDNNVLNIHWSLNMMTPKQILGIVMVVIVSLFFAQSQVNINHVKCLQHIILKLLNILRFTK